MSIRNSLATKKRKKIKFDATSGSISNYLYSSSDSVEVNSDNKSDNSADNGDLTISLSKTIKGRLSNEFDDSFDLFVTKKVSVSSLTNVSKVNDKEAVLFKPEIQKGRLAINNLKKSPKKEIVKKCYYFNDDTAALTLLPCPFCFKFDEDIYVHLNTTCIHRNIVNKKTLSALLNIHSDYWNQRKNLGVPNLNFNESEVFKSNNNWSNNEKKDADVFSSKAPILKWSKAKIKKYLLLRIGQTERENIINKKIGALLISNNSEKIIEYDGTCFSLVEKTFNSDILEQLLFTGLTFWKKSSLKPDEVTESTFYLKAFAPLITPIMKNDKQVPPLLKNEADNDRMISPIRNHSTDNDKLEENVSSQEEKIFSSRPDSCHPENAFEFCALKNNDNCSESKLSNDWDKLFYSSDLSDTTILFNGSTFLGHSLVFWVRSVKIFRSISSSSIDGKGKVLDWKDVPSTVGLSFIKYIYTGQMKHFIDMTKDDLNVIMLLCDKYDEYELKNFINNIDQYDRIEQSNKSNESNKTEANFMMDKFRNVTSPDVFDDVDMYSASVNFDLLKETNDTSNSSKRKLELSPGKLSEDESVKRLKLKEYDAEDKRSGDDDRIIDDDEMSKKAFSESNADWVSISSATSLSPGRNENIVNRPLSQCSTLPPLSVSPVEENFKVNSPSSPPYLTSAITDSKFSPLEDQILDKDANQECFIKTDTNMGDSNSHENSFYYDYNDYDFNIGEGSYNEEITMINKDESKCDSVKCEPGNVTPSQSVKKSLEKYFNDSIPSKFLEMSDISRTPQPCDRTLEDSPICQSTPTISRSEEKNSITPSPQIIVSDQVTPMLNYSNLVTPDLKDELRKYGLKPDMERKKAKKLLKYIYELVHPVIPPNDEGNELDSDKGESKEELSTDKEDIPVLKLNENRDPPESGNNTSSESILANEGCFENGVEFDFDYEKHETLYSQEPTSYLTKDELMKSVSSFIKNDVILFESILQYVPVWLSKFHKALKENGIKCTRNDLMDVLDELCITFRTEKKVEKKKPKR